jgi:hypothetical protein
MTATTDMTADEYRDDFRKAVLRDALRSLSRDIRARQASVRKLEAKRNELVRQALANGWTHAKIAEATGLTRGRIGQLAKSRDSPAAATR